jgi:hypothetical protein
MNYLMQYIQNSQPVVLLHRSKHEEERERTTGNIRRPSVFIVLQFIERHMFMSHIDIRQGPLDGRSDQGLCCECRLCYSQIYGRESFCLRSVESQPTFRRQMPLPLSGLKSSEEKPSMKCQEINLKKKTDRPNSKILLLGHLKKISRIARK